MLHWALCSENILSLRIFDTWFLVIETWLLNQTLLGTCVPVPYISYHLLFTIYPIPA